MYQIILLGIGFLVGYYFAKTRFEGPMLAIHDERRVAVLKLLENQSEIANDDVQKALGVSDATATRYLDALEKQGKIVQIGEHGAGVKYKKK